MSSRNFERPLKCGDCIGIEHTDSPPTPLSIDQGIIGWATSCGNYVLHESITRESHRFVII